VTFVSTESSQITKKNNNKQFTQKCKLENNISDNTNFNYNRVEIVRLERSSFCSFNNTSRVGMTLAFLYEEIVEVKTNFK